MIHYEGAVRDVVLGETRRSSWFAARTRGSKLPRLLLVIGLRACVVGASIWKSFGLGSETLIGSTIVTASMTIEGRMTRIVTSHVVETITEVSGPKCSWRIAESMRGLLRHS